MDSPVRSYESQQWKICYTALFWLTTAMKAILLLLGRIPGLCIMVRHERLSCYYNCVQGTYMLCVFIRMDGWMDGWCTRVWGDCTIACIVPHDGISMHLYSLALFSISFQILWTAFPFMYAKLYIISKIPSLLTLLLQPNWSNLTISTICSPMRSALCRGKPKTPMSGNQIT